MSVTLFELTDDRLRLIEGLLAVEEMVRQAEADDTILGDLEAAEAVLAAELAGCEEDLAAKVDGYCWIIRDLDAQAAAHKAIVDEFAGKARVAANASRRLKDRLKAAMEVVGVDKIVGEQYKLALQANPPAATEVDEQAALAAGYAQEVTMIKVDSRAIIAAWKADPESIDGVAVVAQGRHLRIR